MDIREQSGGWVDQEPPPRKVDRRWDWVIAGIVASVLWLLLAWPVALLAAFFVYVEPIVTLLLVPGGVVATGLIALRYAGRRQGLVGRGEWLRAGGLAIVGFVIVLVVLSQRPLDG